MISDSVGMCRLTSSLEELAGGCCSAWCSADDGTSRWPWMLCWWQSASRRTLRCAPHWSDREPSPTGRETPLQSPFFLTMYKCAMLLNFCCIYFFPLVDVEAVILQFLLQNIRDVDVNMDDLLLAFLLHVNIWLNPLKQVQYEQLGGLLTIRKTRRLLYCVFFYKVLHWNGHFLIQVTVSRRIEMWILLYMRLQSEPSHFYHFVDILWEGAVPTIWRLGVRIVGVAALWRRNQA